MKHVIDTKKITKLLKKSGKKQKELAQFIGCAESNLSESLKGVRKLPMNHIFLVSDFFNVEPRSLVLQENDNTQKNNIERVQKCDNDTTKASYE